jgi:hypothetical protein
MSLYTVRCVSNKNMVPDENPTCEVPCTSCVMSNDSFFEAARACDVSWRRMGNPRVFGSKDYR